MELELGTDSTAIRGLCSSAMPRFSRRKNCESEVKLSIQTARVAAEASWFEFQPGWQSWTKHSKLGSMSGPVRLLKNVDENLYSETCMRCVIGLEHVEDQKNRLISGSPN